MVNLDEISQINTLSGSNNGCIFLECFELNTRFYWQTSILSGEPVTYLVFTFMTDDSDSCYTYSIYPLSATHLLSANVIFALFDYFISALSYTFPAFFAFHSSFACPVRTCLESYVSYWDPRCTSNFSGYVNSRECPFIFPFFAFSFCKGIHGVLRVQSAFFACEILLSFQDP